MLSRLKGIETNCISERKSLTSDFGYAFPFEGNWNASRSSFFIKDLLSFGYAFPFEGNWNKRSWRFYQARTGGYFGYAFPFEGNWNLVDQRRDLDRAPSLWICFPVWRELKLGLPFLPKSIIDLSLWICFPVWRELKLVAEVNGVDPIAKDFGYAFPFEGNWNRLSRKQRLRNFHLYFGYAFPFEGNWNCMIPYDYPKLTFTLDMLSRLKGIETHPTLSPSLLQWLWIWFPVWRELKRDGRPCQFVMPKLWIWFPVWRELKQLQDPPYSCAPNGAFGYGFPFEGNWNVPPHLVWCASHSADRFYSSPSSSSTIFTIFVLMWYTFQTRRVALPRAAHAALCHPPAVVRNKGLVNPKKPGRLL